MYGEPYEIYLVMPTRSAHALIEAHVVRMIDHQYADDRCEHHHANQSRLVLPKLEMPRPASYCKHRYSTENQEVNTEADKIKARIPTVETVKNKSK